MTKRDSTNVKNGFLAALLALATLAISPGAIAGAPTLISSAPGKYCYDFGNYIPSTDSPVVGGVYWSYRGGGAYSTDKVPIIFGFGKVCTTIPMVWGAAAAYYNPGGYPSYINGYLLPYTSSNYSGGGQWNHYYIVESYQVPDFNGGTSTAYKYRQPPVMCQANHAAIRVYNYKRSDGISRPSQPIHPYDASNTTSGYAYSWALSSGVYVASSAYPGWVEPNPANIEMDVCVKTDTTQ